MDPAPVGGVHHVMVLLSFSSSVILLIISKILGIYVSEFLVASYTARWIKNSSSQML